MKCAIYARVSTKDQSVDMQLDALRKFAVARGYEVFREYVDIGISGSKDSRPQLDELMRDARWCKFNIVLVWKFDRFGRSVKHLVTALEEFHHYNIGFASFSENIDTSSPMGKAMFSVIAAMAEFERDLIAERVRAGVSRAIAKGKRWGRKPITLTDSPHLSLRKAAELAGVSRETIRRRRLAE